MKIAEAVEEFIIAKQADGRAPRTLKDYRRVLDPFAAWCQEQNIDLSGLNRTKVREYVLELHQRNWADNTLSIHIRTLRTFLNWLYREGMIMEKLAAFIHPPRYQRRMDDLLTQEDVAALVAACNGDAFATRDKALILMLADTGLRVGELVRLRRKDVHFTDDNQAYLIVYAPKTKTYRFAFLAEKAAAALREYLENREDGEEALWVGKVGPLTASGVYRLLRRRALQAGVDARKVHPHAFRKFFATSWIRNGGDIVRLKALGGWRTLETMEAYVMLARQQDLAEAHRQFSPVKTLR